MPRNPRSRTASMANHAATPALPRTKCADRNDARGIAQLMRLGWFRPVHCKSLPAQETRAADGAQAAADQEPRRRDEPARGAARFRAESWSNDAANLPRPDPPKITLVSLAAVAERA